MYAIRNFNAVYCIAVGSGTNGTTNCTMLVVSPGCVRNYSQ